MEGIEYNPDPTGKTIVTGIYIPFAEGGTAFLAAPSSAFSFFGDILVFCVCLPDNEDSKTLEELMIVLTYKKVLEIFGDYLEKDDDCEIFQSKHGYTVMLWNEAGKNWWDVVCCTSPNELFDKLLETAVWFQAYLMMDKADADDLTKEEQLQVESIRKHYLKLKENEV